MSSTDRAPMISRPSHGVHFGRALPANPPMLPIKQKQQSVALDNLLSPRLPSQMDVEQEEFKILDVEDENLYELEIKNLDTNEVMKMKIPLDQDEQLQRHISSSESGSGQNTS